MPSRNRTASMFNAVAIVSALHLLSEGVIPAAEGTGEPYGINRQVVEGAARAGAGAGPGGPETSIPRGFESRPVPALNQVVEENPSDGEVEKALAFPKDTNGTRETQDAGPPGRVVKEDSERDDSISPPGTLQASIPECNQGRGRVRYERITDSVMDPTNTPYDSIRLKDTPGKVLAKCEDLCLRDTTSESDLEAVCLGFDYVPGKRFSSYSYNLGYTETKCLTYRKTSQFEPIRYINANGSFHMREVCYEAAAVRTECPTEKYVMERVRERSFLPLDHIQVQADTLEECQDKCLSQYPDNPVNNTRVCRAGCFDHSSKRCYHSSYTRRTHPKEIQPNPSFDYFENTCLSVDRRCPKNKLMFVKETNRELGGAYDTDVYENLSFEECKAKCLDGEKIFCRSLEYDQQTRTCVISDEDSQSRPDEMRTSISDKNEYYEVLCIDGDQVKGEYVFEDSNTQQLNQRRYRDVRTAFQLYRKSRLQLNSGFRGSRGRERSRLTLAECLDECLEERSFTCRSVMYSNRYQTCQLSEYDQLNGNLVYDSEYDYYENLMENLVVNQAASGSADSSVAVAGQRTGFSAQQGSTGGLTDTGPGSAGQTGQNRPIAGGSFSTVGQSGTRVSSDSNFGGTGGGRVGATSSSTNGFGSSRGSNNFSGSVGGSSSFDNRGGGANSNSRFNANNDRRFRPSSEALDERPGLFNPISTDFRNSVNGGRQTSSFGFDNRRQSGSFGFDTRRQTSSFGGDRQTATTTGTRGTANSPMESGEVSQLCTEEGMEFSLRTDEPFRGRIYTYGYYDRCFSRGSGSTINILKISGPKGFPDCGTSRYGETTTNIVVVQFSDNVQTSLDKRYNLTCTIVGPGEAVVTSGYIGAGSGAPTPIEYLPAENQLQSKVRLQILYGGRPTTTIAVGDPLTFKLESQRGFNLVSDIFATNVVAKDPYSGRRVNLIDSRGCPIDPYVFPSLGQGREGNALEARFNAFKIPESNSLIFEATVRTCRGGCQPARCVVGSGREEVESFGRRRRRNADDIAPDPYGEGEEEEEDEEEKVHGIYEVYMTREEIDDPLPQIYLDEVCLATSEYYTLVTGLIITIICLLASLVAVGLCFRKHRQLGTKNALADAGNPYHHNQASQQQQPQHLQQKTKFAFPGSHARTLTQPASYFPSSETTASPQGEDGAATSSRYPDPSEPIYTDPGLFERAKSQRKADDASGFSSRLRFGEGED